MECTPEELIEIARAHTDILSTETQAILVRLNAGGSRSELIHLYGAPLSDPAKEDIKNAIRVGIVDGGNSETDMTDVELEEAGLTLELVRSQEMDLGVDELVDTPVRTPAVAESGSSQNPFITTPGLEKFGLKFNPQYTAIYCCECQQLLPLASLYNHLTKGLSYLGRQVTRGQSIKEIGSIAHRKFVGVPKNISVQIRRELEEDPGLTGVTESTEFPDSNAWPEWAFPHPDQTGLMDYLPVYQGFQCEGCNRGALTTSQFAAKHKREGHKSRLGPIQTFYRMSRPAVMTQWFHIPDPTPESLQSLSKVDIRKKKASLLAGSFNLDNFSRNDAHADARSMPQCFKDTGIGDEILKLNHQILPRAPSYNLGDDLVVQRLRTLVRKGLTESADKARTCSRSLPIRNAIAKAIMPENAIIEPFTPPNSKTVKEYAVREFGFLYTLLQEHAKPTLLADGSPLMTFSNRQKAAFSVLLKGLNRKKFEDEECRPLLEEALRTFYFAEDMEPSDSVWKCPLTAYVYIQGVGKSGEFMPASHMVGILSAMQLAMRLRGHDILLNELDMLEGSTTGDWKIHEFCAKFLSPGNLSQFSILRGWLLKFFAGMRLQVPTSHTMCRWIDANTVLMAGNRRIDVQILKTFVRNLIECATTRVQDKILFGLKLAQMGIRFEDIKDDGRRVPGYSPISSGPDFPHNPDSLRYLSALLTGKHMGLYREGSRLRWGYDLWVAWKADIEKAWLDLYVLSHILGGPKPLLQQQEASLRLITTVRPNESAITREVFVTDGRLSFITNRRERAKGAGSRRADIIHVLPAEVSKLFYTLIRVVRPVELTLLFIADVIKEPDATLRVCRDYVFVANGARLEEMTLEQGFRERFRAHLGFEVTRATYLSLAWCLATRVAPAAVPPDPLADVADRQAGRGKDASEGNYGILQENHGMVPSQRDPQMKRNGEWHRFFHLL
ncbi:hypothetical protein B0H12DRAFT_1161334 [Mycena haematopus]|nr:hypothetical protein B0H12DRAFT_1161334 [Mycena haematopus]